MQHGQSRRSRLGCTRNLDCRSRRGKKRVHERLRGGLLAAVRWKNGTCGKNLPRALTIPRFSRARTTRRPRIPCAACGQNGHGKRVRAPGNMEMKHIHTHMHTQRALSASGTISRHGACRADLCAPFPLGYLRNNGRATVIATIGADDANRGECLLGAMTNTTHLYPAFHTLQVSRQQLGVYRVACSHLDRSKGAFTRLCLALTRTRCGYHCGFNKPSHRALTAADGDSQSVHVFRPELYLCIQICWQRYIVPQLVKYLPAMESGLLRTRHETRKLDIVSEATNGQRSTGPWDYPNTACDGDQCTPVCTPAKPHGREVFQLWRSFAESFRFEMSAMCLFGWLTDGKTGQSPDHARQQPKRESSGENVLATAAAP